MYPGRTTSLVSWCRYPRRNVGLEYAIGLRPWRWSYTGYESIDLEYGQPQDTVCILSDIEPTEDHDSLFTTMAVCCIKSWVLRMFKTGPPHQYEYLSTREHTSY